MPTIQVTGPSYVPSGYSLSQRVQGVEAGGFGESSGQTGLFYRRGAALDDWLNPLTAYIGPSNAPDLVATENHPGQVVDLGAPEVNAVYHDGMWIIGQGQDQEDAGATFLHWDTSAIHSITARWPTGMAAVRGPKGRGVGYDELVKVAKSLFAGPGTNT